MIFDFNLFLIDLSFRLGDITYIIVMQCILVWITYLKSMDMALDPIEEHTRFKLGSRKGLKTLYVYIVIVIVIIKEIIVYLSYGWSLYNYK